MNFLDQVRSGYTTPEPKENTWRKRFSDVHTWAIANPWDDIPKIDDKEVKICISELFEAVNMACAGFRFIQEKTGDSNAKAIADILEGQ